MNDVISFLLNLISGIFKRILTASTLKFLTAFSRTHFPCSSKEELTSKFGCLMNSLKKKQERSTVVNDTIIGKFSIKNEFFSMKNGIISFSKTIKFSLIEAHTNKWKICLRVSSVISLWMRSLKKIIDNKIKYVHLPKINRWNQRIPKKFNL